MAYLNEWFDEIVVINLKRSQDRMERISEHMKEKGLSFTRFDAVDGTHLSANQLSELTTPFCNEFCSKSMIGCGLSHMGVWKLAQEKNVESLLILEDDVYIDPQCSETLERARHALPPDWDILFLGCIGSCSSPFSTETVFIPTFPLGLYAYALSRSGYTKLLERIDRVNYHIDFQVSAHKKSLNMYAVNPPCVYQDSEIESTNMHTNPFPRGFNRFLDCIHGPNTIKLSWYANITLLEWKGIPLNGISFFLILVGILSSKYPPILALTLIVLAMESVYCDKQFVIGVGWIVCAFILHRML
jgi:GR25 family glycosyltransferase involved in LPS biosynthesis